MGCSVSIEQIPITCPINILNLPNYIGSKTIRNIDPVITAYPINKNNLKSKDFLIF